MDERVTTPRYVFMLVALAIFVVGGITFAVTATGPVASQEGDDSTIADAVFDARVPMMAKDGPAGTLSYTVQSGDTLFSIASAHGTTVSILMQLNTIDDPSVIVPGWHLNIPVPTPTPTPTPSPTPTATPTPPPGPSQTISHGPRGTNQIALTFDMGGAINDSLAIMNWLVANEVKATIFPTGAIVDATWTDAGRQVLAIVDANQHLFELGNHSYNHPDFTELTPAEMVEELHSTEAAIAPYTAMSMRPIWRPPFGAGAFNSAVLNAVGPAGYPYTIYWDIDTIDWREDTTKALILSRVLNNAQGGSIVLMHLGGLETYEALPELIAGLQAQGLQPVTLSEMLGY